MSSQIACLLTVFLTSLTEYMQSQSGKAIIASDELHAWEYSQNNENFPKAILLYQGDELRDDYPVAAINRISKISFSCIVSRNRGLTVDRGQSLTQTVGNARPLFEIVEEIRDIIRCQTSELFIEMPVDYSGTSKWQTGAFISDAYSIQFSVPQVLPAISLLNPNI